MIVGVTGGIGTGKSTVCSIFAQLGVATTSADDLAKEIINTDPVIFNQIINKFNRECITIDNTIDRQQLRKRIFDSSTDRIWLEGLLHPLIMQKIAQYAAHVKTPYCVIEIPLLLESKLEAAVDHVLIIDCPEELQLARASARDQLSKKQIQKVMATQLTREQRLAAKYDILENLTDDLAVLKKRVKELHDHYLALSAAKNY